MTTMSKALAEAEVGPRVVQKVFYGGALGATAAIWWWGFSVISVAFGAAVGSVIGLVAGIALVLFAAFAAVMISRK